MPSSSSRNFITALLGFSVLTLLSVGCGDSPLPNYLVNKPRLLGIDVSVVGDESRTEVAPGETVNLRIPVAAPGPEIESTAFLAICVPGDGTFGVDFCGDDPFDFTAIFPGEVELEYEFTVPNDLPVDTDSLLLIGAVCLGGEVNFDLSSFDPSDPPDVCTDPEDLGYIVTSKIDLRGDDEPNTDPAFETIELGDTVFSSIPRADAELRGCAGLDYQTLRVGGGGVFPLRVTPTEGSRETYVSSITSEETTENVEVRVYVTDGQLERLLTLVDDGDPVAINEWTPPPVDEVTAEGTLVQFFITLGDGRGGFANETRAVCVLPPE